MQRCKDNQPTFCNRGRGAVSRWVFSQAHRWNLELMRLAGCDCRAIRSRDGWLTEAKGAKETADVGGEVAGAALVAMRWLSLSGRERISRMHGVGGRDLNELEATAS